MGLISRVSSRTYRSNKNQKTTTKMADAAALAALKKKRTFKKFAYRGVDLDNLLDLSIEEFTNMTNSRHRRAIKKRHQTLVAKMRKAKKECAVLEKPKPVKTHCRNVMVLPDMIGNIIGVYNGKMMLGIEVKPEMVGTYFGEYGITYKPVRHGRAGIGATHSSRFIPLK